MFAACAAALALALATGCGGGEAGSGASTAPAPGGQADRQRPRRAAETVTQSHCPPGHPACRTTSGRIVYVERVDPDGDGDAHFVLADPQGITVAGLTAIDLRKGLRPHPLPSYGDLVSAAGPVQIGSYGQRQIHALEFHVAGR